MPDGETESSMTLRLPCEHGRYEAHQFGSWAHETDCPGGEFLAEDALIAVDRGELRKALEEADYIAEQGNNLSPSYRDRAMLALAEAAEKYLNLLDVLAVREGAE